MRTTARREGGDWVLDGVKRWIGMGSIADVAVVWARADDDVRGFLVPGRHAWLRRAGHHRQARAARVDPVRVAL
jgi:alkylation response protein AidB-like acyl-CoA dehydrogenase